MSQYTSYLELTRQHNMADQFARTRLLLGDMAMEKLRQARVAVFGIGGVGGYVCEALARSGVGGFGLVDNDRICLTNLNRQIIATRKTLGRLKTDVMRERILEINPEASVRVYNLFFLPGNAGEFPFGEYDYVVDAVDTVTAKIALATEAQKYHIPIISSMGTGNKLDGSLFRVADIYETRVCPLARIMRRELKKRGVESLKVVYSEEIPISPCSGPESHTEPFLGEDGGFQAEGGLADGEDGGGLGVVGREADACGGESAGFARRRSTPGSVAFVPPAAGLLIAGEVVKDLLPNVFHFT